MCNNFSHLSDPKFDIINNWIRDRWKNGKDWSWIAKIGKSSWLNDKHDIEDWPLINEDEWQHIVDIIKKSEESNLLNLQQRGLAVIVGNSDDNNLHIPTDPHSSWQTYRKRLSNNGFSEESISSIEQSAHNVVKRISLNTQNSDPIKGLVIGNVQSGKTANMAAVMSMAADHGWNFFIILSGTLENLRLQTKERLEQDLENCGNITWTSLDQLCKTTRKKNCPINYMPDRIGLTNNSKQRNFVVCLKNTKRLRDLYNWLNWDVKFKQMMKILVIDDECDQGSINTADSNKRTAINNWICRIVNDTNQRHIKNSEHYAAMNYIGYTATPYANILNETSKESLYPRNFILTLPVSNEYFGPQQIYGCENSRYEGLNIIRTVDAIELSKFKDIHKGITSELPRSLEKAICWFLCCVSAMRRANYKKPISMLVHTSHQILHHDNITNVIHSWLNNTDEKKILQTCESIWNEETAKFSRDSFIESYDDYGSKGNLHEYPTFAEIKNGIKFILKTDVKPVRFDSNDELEFHEGIHLCVDNSANNPTADEDENWRLCYPSPKMSPYPSPAPAFIVIGGATLSRGLTIEGLVSTFFLREVGTADSLMQMGRWFGYRKKYELYPRIWMSEKTIEKFDALATLDQNLRDEISWMSVTGNSPSMYAAKLDHFGIIKLSAANRTQAMMPAEMDFRGSFNQTYLFDNDFNTLTKNLESTKEFIESLGCPEEQQPINTHAQNCNIWRGVKLDIILEYLDKYQFNERLTIFKDMTPLINWMREMTNKNELANWNIILAGKSSGKIYNFANCSTTMVNRTRKVTASNIADTINIGVLSAPTDIIADIDLNGKSDEFKNKFAKEKDCEKMHKKLRYEAGLTNVPQLIIYIVDKDSQASQKSLNAGTRTHLNAPADIAGICLNVPGAPKNGSAVSKVHAIIMNQDGGDID